MSMVLTARSVTAERLYEALKSPESLDELLDDERADDGQEVDVDKAWHGIHWLLTGSADDTPSSPRRRWLFRRRADPAPDAGAAWWAVLGGEPLGEDIGYGPARILRPHQVAAVAAALEPITQDVLADRMDARAMDAAGSYPEIWDEANVYEEYLGPAYADLRQLYLGAAARGEAVILAIQ